MRILPLVEETADILCEPLVPFDWNNPQQDPEELSNILIEAKESEIKIWLVDPTYTQQQISSESMPSASGGIATFTEKQLQLKLAIRIFK